MNLYCDRFSVCNSMILDRGPDTENVARAKGWHLWKGTTMGGQEQEVTLCDTCVEAGRRVIRPKVELLPDQYPIPELRIIKPGDE
jgi:hypothetical protein